MTRQPDSPEPGDAEEEAELRRLLGTEMSGAPGSVLDVGRWLATLDAARSEVQPDLRAAAEAVVALFPAGQHKGPREDAIASLRAALDADIAACGDPEHPDGAFCTNTTGEWTCHPPDARSAIPAAEGLDAKPLTAEELAAARRIAEADPYEVHFHVGRWLATLDAARSEVQQPPMKWSTINQDASERGLFDVVDKAMIGRKLTPTRRRLIVGNIVSAVARWRESFRDCGCWKTEEGYALCPWHEAMLQSQVAPLRATLVATPAPALDVGRLHQAILDELAILWGEPSDAISTQVRPIFARQIVDRYLRLTQPSEETP